MKRYLTRVAWRVWDVAREEEGERYAMRTSKEALGPEGHEVKGYGSM